MRYACMIACLAGLVLLFACAGSAVAAGNFSQYPGFAEYFEVNPPAGAAGPADRALARQRCATA